MAGTITIQTLVDGSRNVIIKAAIAGNADLTNAVLFDASAYIGGNTKNKLMKIEFSLVGFSAALFWDATANVGLLDLPSDHPDEFSFEYNGGLINNAGTGRTGDILITTTGIGAGDTGTIILYIKKK